MGYLFPSFMLFTFSNFYLMIVTSYKKGLFEGLIINEIIVSPRNALGVFGCFSNRLCRVIVNSFKRSIVP